MLLIQLQLNTAIIGKAKSGTSQTKRGLKSRILSQYNLRPVSVKQLLASQVEIHGLNKHYRLIFIAYHKIPQHDNAILY